MPDEPITIRRVESLDEYDECVRIEHEVWGNGFTEAVPATILRITQEVGGVTAAAFAADGQMLGFVFGMTGVRHGELAHWSDILAVRENARDAGLGTRLKLFQRDLVRAVGVRTMYWTYDPLVARNAYVNLVRLGARVTAHRVNYYGNHTGSEMHGALGTDRFIVSWDITRDILPAPESRPNGPIVNAGATLRELPRDPVVRIAIPADIFAVLRADPAAARNWRASTRGAFDAYFARGYTVVGFQRTPEGGTYSLKQTQLPDER